MNEETRKYIDTKIETLAEKVKEDNVKVVNNMIEKIQSVFFTLEDVRKHFDNLEKKSLDRHSETMNTLTKFTPSTSNSETTTIPSNLEEKLNKIEEKLKELNDLRQML